MVSNFSKYGPREWLRNNINLNTAVVVLGFAALFWLGQYFETIANHEKDIAPLRTFPERIERNRDATILLDSRVSKLEETRLQQLMQLQEISRQLAELNRQMGINVTWQEANSIRLNRIEGKIDK